jgi:hypothetical protein
MGTDPDVDDWGWDVLASTNPWNISTINNGTQSIGSGTVDFWKGIYSVWGSLPDGSETYFRHKDGLNPNNLNIVVGAANGIGILINGATYDSNTIDSIWVRGFDTGIQIQAACTGNTVVRCRLTNHYRGVSVVDPPINTTIHYNRLSSGIDGGGYVGAYGVLAGGETEALGLNELTYLWWKYTYHVTSSDSFGIYLDDASSGTTVEHNLIDLHLIGITWTSATTGHTSLDVSNNRITNTSSIGIQIQPGSAGNIHRNLIMNCQANFRFHNMQLDDASTYYIYNNISWQPHQVGNHIFFNYQAGAAPTATRDYKVYHNTFSGGFTAIYWVTTIADAYSDHPDLEFYNNVFSISYRPIYLVIDTPAKLGGTDAFDYNWLYGSNFVTANESEAWYGSNNIKNTTTPAFSQTGTPNANWSLPDGHAAKNAAGSLSATWPEYNALGADMGAYIVDGNTARPKVRVYSLGSA